MRAVKIDIPVPHARAFLPQHIGIVACSAEGAALCYRTLCHEAGAHLGGHAHPEVTLQSTSLSKYLERIEADDWRGVGALMVASADKLAAGGADFLICPDNTIHRALPYVLEHSPRPWLPIHHAVAAEAVHRGYRRVGIIGTRWLVESDLYPTELARRGVGARRPTPEQTTEINRIIMDELVPGEFKPAALAYLQRVIAGMKAAGCDAVVLGCTEIPLILDDRNSPLPTLDSTRLLARAALERALAGRA